MMRRADPEPEPRAPGEGRPWTVSELTAQVKTALEAALPACWVIGEVSDFTHHASGHRYFTLKDESSQLSCVMFKHQARTLAFAPEPGMKLMAYGQVSVYERGGRYQFYASLLQPAGEGEMALAFEELKRRLEAEGLFDPERKRPLPSFPKAVGVVTSATGAAIRDIVQILARRAPGLQIVLRPARVQGPGAAAEIARAIADLNSHGQVDILIVGRGGGSLEDLWPFNEEIVARAIYASARPVISAVGHEVDYTIADYVADHRAPTPSAAAEIVARDHGELRRRIAESSRRLQLAVQHRFDAWDRELEALSPRRQASRLTSRLDQASQYVDERRQSLAAALDWYLRRRRETWRTACVRLSSVDPLAPLERGLVRCERLENGQPVRRAQDLKPGERVRLRFLQGGAVCRVEDILDA